MENRIITEAVTEWEELARSVLELREIQVSQIEGVLKKTYAIIRELCSGALVPKELCRLMLSAEEFLYLASLMEKNEKQMNYYHFIGTYLMVAAMKNGLFEGCFEYTPVPYSERDKAKKVTVSMATGEIAEFLHTIKDRSEKCHVCIYLDS
ncbi:MAG: hypothetical protein IJD22_02815 [Clostridia bacterium]|nr:hypothetical protein [Clostridia bacterium]